MSSLSRRNPEKKNIIERFSNKSSNWWIYVLISIIFIITVIAIFTYSDPGMVLTGMLLR